MNDFFSSSKNHNLKFRLYIIGGISILSFFFILLHIFNLQITNRLVYEKRAKDVSSRSNIIPALRGNIYDRNEDVPLAMNIDTFSLMAIPADMNQENFEDELNQLSETLNIPYEDLEQKFPKRTVNSFNPVTIMENADFEQIVKVSENIESYSGVYWENKPVRFYNRTGSISHVLGYLGNITTDELQILYNEGYSHNSFIGKSGIERQYDSLLRGKDGKKINIVDVKGKTLGNSDSSIEIPENGFDLILTIDRHLQTLSEKALGPRKGSVIIMKPSTGEILAMVSYPSYNPNLFQEPGENNFSSLSLNQDFPFLNRSVQSSYAPASTFKVFMTAALLEEGYDPKLTHICEGSMNIGNRTFFCWKKTGHGQLNMQQALAQSCNIYFGQVGIDYLKIDKINYYARLFGFGEKTDIDIAGEVTGTVPSKDWKEQVYNTAWTPGDTLNTSIGQGFLTVTPIQMANAISAIVNEGPIYKPHLLKKVIKSSSGEIIEEKHPELLREVPLKQSTFTTLKDYMRKVVTEGTAEVVIVNDAVKVAAKTGTGEVGLEDHWHSWFVSFGPYDAPKEDQIVVITMVEASNDWDWWAPAAADIIYQGYYSGRSYEEVIDYYRRRGVWYLSRLKEMDID